MWQDALQSRLRTLREVRGLKQTDLSQATGIQSADISRYETGSFVPTLGNLYRLADGLGVTVYDLLTPTAEGEVEPAHKVADGQSLKEAVRVYIAKSAAGATDEEVELAFGLAHQTVSPRRRELVLAGLVKDSGERRKTSSGRQATVWVSA